MKPSNIRPVGVLGSHISLTSLLWTSDWLVSSWLLKWNSFCDFGLFNNAKSSARGYLSWIKMRRLLCLLHGEWWEGRERCLFILLIGAGDPSKVQTMYFPNSNKMRWLGIFLFTTASRTALGPTQPPKQRVLGALSVGVKRPGREADHSPPSSAEVKE